MNPTTVKAIATITKSRSLTKGLRDVHGTSSTSTASSSPSSSTTSCPPPSHSSQVHSDDEALRHVGVDADEAAAAAESTSPGAAWKAHTEGKEPEYGRPGQVDVEEATLARPTCRQGTTGSSGPGSWEDASGTVTSGGVALGVVATRDLSATPTSRRRESLLKKVSTDWVLTSSSQVASVGPTNGSPENVHAHPQKGSPPEGLTERSGTS